jgi:sugar transferase EpsL
MLTQTRHTLWPSFATRCIALLLLLGLSIPMLIIALAVWWQLGQPILFKQQRAGLHGHLFTLYKFRSMQVVPASADLSTINHAARLNSFGRWLRHWSFDEWPQLWNIIRGDLNFIGPRPLLPEYLPYYNAEQWRRHWVKPGITGWAQVNGRNAISWEEKFALDVWYVDHQSIKLDGKILLRTVRHLLHPQGVQQPGFGTSDKFKG